MSLIKKWKRACPNLHKNYNCKGIIEYSTKKSYKIAVNKNSVCRSCLNSGKSNPMYGKKRPDASERMKGKNNPMF